MDASRFATFVFSRGGNIIAPDASGYALGDEAGVETLKFWRGLVEKDARSRRPRLTATRRTSGMGSLFTVSSISGLPYYGTAVSEGAGFEECEPAAAQHGRAADEHLWGEPVDLREHARGTALAAWLFNKYLSEPEQQAMWASSTGYFPDARPQRIC